MTVSTTLSLRLPPKVKKKLGQLAAKTQRSRSFLAAEAIEAYVKRELEIVSDIQEGLADMESGRLVSHRVAMARARKAIRRARR